jgi:ribose transport system substrate-binding protein
MNTGFTPGSHPYQQEKKMNTTMRRKWRGVTLTAVAFALTAALTACSGGASIATGAGAGTGADEASVTEQQQNAIDLATERVEAAKAEAEFVAPGPAFSVADLSGKKVFVIAHLIGTNHFTDTLLASLEEAMEPLDVELIVRDAQVNPAKASAAVDEAINQGADLIMGFVLPTAVMEASFKSAKDAGIPVIQLFAADPDVDDSAAGVVSHVSFCYSCGAALMADYAIMDSGADITAAAWESSDVGTSQYSVEGLTSELEELCPETCTIDTMYNAEAPVWAQRVPGQVSAALANPEINWLLPVFDSHITWIQPAMATSGRTDVSVASFNGQLSAMQQMASDPTVRALVHSPVEWGSWAAADQALRVLAGEPPVDQQIPLRLFDQENLPDLESEEGSWMGGDFKAGYQSLWQD